MKVLVSGGAGFIGSQLVEALVEVGDDVRVIDDLSSGRLDYLASVADDIEFRHGDIRDPAVAAAACRDRDVVFHLAGMPSVPLSFEQPLRSHEVNATATLTLALAARDAGVKRLINTSSSSVYGAARRLPARETATPLPVSPYAVAKLAGEGYCRAVAVNGGLETVSLRLFNVYGPRQEPRSGYGAVVPSFIVKLLDGRPPTIFGDGHQSRSFTFVGDVVSAMSLAMRADRLKRDVYNVASPSAVSVIELFTTLCDLLESDVRPEFAAVRVGDVRRSQADISAVSADLGFAARVSLRSGLASTIAHLLDRGSAAKPRARRVAVRR